MAFRSHALQILFLTIVTGLIYAQCVNHDFLTNWDDNTYVVDNLVLRSLSWENLRAMFSQYYVSNYAPLQILSYALDYRIWGLWPGGYALTNICLHLANGLLLYLLVWRLAGTRRAALLAAAIFLFHPLQVESVAWISQRKNVLAMFFFLLSLLAYLRYRTGLPAGSRLALLCSLAAFAAATLSKSVAVILPVVLLLLDLATPDRTDKRLVLRDKLPYLAIAILCGVVALASQSPENLSGGRRDYLAGSPLVTLQTMLPVFARYLGLILWPEGLSNVYNPEIREHVDAQVILAGILLLLILAALALLFRRNRQLFFWLGLFLVGFLPVSQIIPLITLMNDRYCYFPLLGIAGGCGTLCAGSFTRGGWQEKALRAAAGVALLLLAILSWQRAAVWKDSVTLWSAASRAGEHVYGYDKHFVETALAAAHIKRGQQEELQGELHQAARDYLAAVTAAPDDYDALESAGVFFTRNNKPLLGRRYLLRLTENYPRSSAAWLNLGFNYLHSRDFDRSAEAAAKALQLRAGDGKSRLLLGHVAMQSGRADKARTEYLAAEAAGVKDPDLAYNLACLEARSGRPQEALARLRQSLSWGYSDLEHMASDPDLAAARQLPEFGRLLANFKPHTANTIKGDH